MMKFIPTVLVLANIGLSHGRDWLLQIDYDNDNQHQSTGNDICIELINAKSVVLNQRCEKPPNRGDSHWLPGRWLSLNDIDGSYWTICNTGDDAFLVDQVIIRQKTTWYSKAYRKIGADNNSGWCLSTDRGDHTGFDGKAAWDRCERCMSVDFNGRWDWGTLPPAAKYLRGNEGKGQEGADA